MLKIENIDVYGWEAAIRGMRNPKNSWDKTDSIFEDGHFEAGVNDLSLMRVLAHAGTDHRKFMRMINVTLDITAPLYWWKEFDTYKVGTVANSCSTMHKLADKEFTLEDFSSDHLLSVGCDLFTEPGDDGQDFNVSPLCFLRYYIIPALNSCRELYLETSNKAYWWQMIQLLPASYNQRRTVQLNYEVLANIYHARQNHRLDEWHTLCYWIEDLPYSELITGVERY